MLYLTTASALEFPLIKLAKKLKDTIEEQMRAIAEFPLIKLAKKLKVEESSKQEDQPSTFPLIKLAKKLKVTNLRKEIPTAEEGMFPLIKLAKKLKELQSNLGILTNYNSVSIN